MICQQCIKQNHVLCPAIQAMAKLVEESDGHSIKPALIDGAKTLCNCLHRTSERGRGQPEMR